VAGAVGAEPEAAERRRAEPRTDESVTVVPGIARYHRSECILIRFLGADDLETMTRSAAEDANFAACRACQPDKSQVDS
jgi:hypothetical protein